MTVCPAGHDSVADDYCDECGVPIPRASGHGAVTAPADGTPAPGQPCPACHEAQQDPSGRYCESCGHDMTRPAVADAQPPPSAVAPVAPSPGTAAWSALVRADRDWFERVRAESGPDVGALEFPAHCPERRFELTGPRMLIGRTSRSRGTNPDIDLTGPPRDPGVSAMHAVLVQRPDGGWDVVDLDSANGTRVGRAPEPITPHRPVPLRPGETLRLGAWTTITIGAEPGAGDVD